VYNLKMNNFRFQYPISVRYGDLDPQWHVNNARFLTFIEQARLAYLLELGLFDGHSFWDLPLIVGDVHCRYHAPIEPNITVIVGMGVTKIGTSSLTIESTIKSRDGSLLYATAETIMVSFDYAKKVSIPVPAEMRKIIGKYEGKTL